LSVKLYQIFQRSLGLLSPRERYIVYKAACIQVALSMIDLFALLLLSITTYTFFNGFLPKQFAPLFEFVGLQKIPVNKIQYGLVIATVLLFITKSIFSQLYLTRILRFLGNCSLSLCKAYTSRYFEQSISRINSKTTSRLVFIFGSAFDIATIEVLGAFVSLIAEVSLLILLTIFLLSINVSASACILIYFGFIFWLLDRTLRSPSNQASISRSKSHLSAAEQITSLKNTYREALVYKKKYFFANRFNNHRREATSAHRKLIAFAMAPKYFFEAAFYLGVGILFIALLLTTDKTNAASQFVFYLACGSRLLPSLIRAQASIGSVRATSGACDPMFEMVNEMQAEAFAIEKESISMQTESEILTNKTVAPLIQVKNLLFSYGDENPWKLKVEDFTLDIGNRIGIVGASGSGKSTFIDILLGVHTYYLGHVSLNGQTPSLAVNNERNLIGYVPQKVHLFPGTILENVSIAEHGEADISLVNHALFQAGMEEFVSSLPMGLYTQIQESGNNFSGGQVQRLGIARALYRQPKLLVLDEATSSLDAANEELIMQTIKRLSNDISILAISHNESILKDFDKIFRFHNGEIKHLE